MVSILWKNYKNNKNCGKLLKNQNRSVRGYKNINYKQLLKMKKESSSIIILDVRSVQEYNKFHLEGAVNLPYDDSHNIMRKSNPDKEQNLIIYCSAGKRSVQARNLLVYLGYKNVYLLSGHEDFFDK